jgi:hypothetical protein
LVDSNGYSKPLKITSLTLTTFDIYLQLSIPNIMFFLSKLKEKYSPDYMQQIFEIITEKIDFLEPYEKETLEIILTYGFYENFIVTSHIIPAFCEKLFTKILIFEGLDLNVVKGALVERKQMTQYFNPLSKEYQCLTRSFKETDLYDLYIILIAMNFRNNLYHGKESGNETKSYIAFYLWYVFSRLILLYKKS